MKVLTQLGYGKSDYVDSAIKDESIAGVILSPRDEDPSSLVSLAKSYTSRGLPFIALDPQFYAYTIPEARLRYLDKVPYYPDGFITRRQFSNLAQLKAFSTDALDYQFKLKVTHLISPAIQLADLRDSNSQTFLTMAQESISHVVRKKDRRPLLLSLILEESALVSPEAVDEFLDILTAWEFGGVYICVQPRGSAYPSPIAPTAMANLLYLIYVLSDLNGYEVVVGYADFNGLLYGAAGADYMASGWYNSLKQFSISRFIPKKGGARARARYPSLPLLASILVEPELSDIVDSGRKRYGLSDLGFDRAFADNVSSALWPPGTSCRAHLAAFNELADDVTGSARSVKRRMAYALERIERAQSTILLLRNEGVVFETRFTFLNIWQEAIDQFLERLD